MALRVKQGETMTATNQALVLFYLILCYLKTALAGWAIQAYDHFFLPVNKTQASM